MSSSAGPGSEIVGQKVISEPVGPWQPSGTSSDSDARVAGTVASVDTISARSETWISYEELTAEALAADPNLMLGADAVPFDAGRSELALLPDWYMPIGGRPRHVRIAAVVVALVVGSLLLAEAFGHCLTSGHIEIPL